MIKDWHDKKEKKKKNLSDLEKKYCTYVVYYGNGDCFAKGVWVKDTIEHQTSFEKKSIDAYFGYIYK